MRVPQRSAALSNQGCSSPDPISPLLTREVRVHYGVASVTVSVVELVHSRIAWQSRARLVAIRQIPAEEWSRAGESLLAEFSRELLLASWPISEGDSDVGQEN